METTPKKILDALQNGLSQQEMVAHFPAETLSSDEMEDLFSKAKLLGRSQVAHRLLVYLIQVSKDDWFNVRVLALLVQHARDSAQDQTGRLIAMRKILDRLVKTLPENGDQFNHYQKLNAFYYVLAARSRRDVGDMDRALSWYETALQIYKGLGLDSSVEKVVQELQSLHVERRAFALTSASHETAASMPGSVVDLDAADPQPVSEFGESGPLEEEPAAEPAAEEDQPLPAQDRPVPEASDSASFASQPEPPLDEPAPAGQQVQYEVPQAPLPAEPQPEPETTTPALPQVSPAPASILPFAAESQGLLDEEIRALGSQRDALLIEVQDLGQQGESLQAQVAKTQKRLKGLETRVKEQQRILEEKQALIQQMDRLSAQEARLRQTVAQLEQQEKDQTAKLEILYSEARLLEKQVDVMKRHTAPLIPVEPQVNGPESS